MLSKKLMTFVSAVLAMGLLAGCGGGNQQGSKNTSGTSETSSQLSSETVESKFTVNFYVDGAVYRTVTDVEKGSKLQAPTAPTKQQDDDFTYEFDGWYKSGATTAWNFETDVVNADLDLYAKFNQTARQYDLTIWVWGGTTTVYITEDEFDALATTVNAYQGLANKAVRWKYVNTLTNSAFNDAVNNSHVSLVVSGAKMDNDEASITLDEEGGKTKVGFGWFNSVNRYVGIVAGLNNAEFTLAKLVYDELKQNGPYYFTAEIDNASILVDGTAQLSAKNGEDVAITEGLTYSVADDTIASVSATGLVTGLAVGETTVSVHYGFAQRDIAIGVTNQQVNLKVAVWGQNGSNTYATQEEIDTCKEAFETYAANHGTTVVSRFDLVSGKTADYPANIGSDVMVVLSGKNVKTQCGTLTDYPVINATFTSVRYFGIVDGYADDPIVQLFADFLCNDTIVVNFGGGVTAEPQNITALGGETVSWPTVTIPNGKELKGWTNVEDGESLFGAESTVNYENLKEYAVNHAVTLYPVIGDVPAVVNDLVIDILMGTSTSTKVTEDDVELIRTTFQNALTAAGYTDKHFEIRHEFFGSGANFNARTNAAGDVDVAIGASNLSSQNGFEGLMVETSATNITIAISDSGRYAFALAGAATRGHGDLAKLFLSAMAPSA